MTCPLCGSGESRAGWAGRTVFLGREYGYRECGSCRSLYCQPMPDVLTLAEMYGPSYMTRFAADGSEHESSRDVARVLAALRRLGTGSFLDYGCGSGTLLSAAAESGWRVAGVEPQAEVARRVTQATGFPVLTPEETKGTERADVLHLGDVIEHLTDARSAVRFALGLLKPGGTLLAQGPLEANPCLFTLLIRWRRLLHRPQPSTMPPFHVILATGEGQATFFKELGLATLEYRISEVSWPAPAHLSLRVLGDPRLLTLYLLRLASRSFSRIRPDRWGNRYFYVGRWLG